MACNCQPTKPCDNSCKMNSKDVCYTGIDLTCIDIFPLSHTVENYLIKIDEILCRLLNGANVNYGILTLNANGQEVGTFAALGAIDTIFNINLDNIGLGAQVFKAYNALTDTHELRSITKTGDLIVVTENPDDIEITIDEDELDNFIQANQKTYTIDNVGSGEGIYVPPDDIVGDNTDFNFKSLLLEDAAPTGVTIIDGIDTSISDELSFKIKTLDSNTLVFDSTTPGILKVNLPETSGLLDFYVRNDATVTYFDWLSANTEDNGGTPVPGYQYKGYGTMAKPFVDTRVYTLGAPATPAVVTSNTALTHAKTAYIGTGNMFNPEFGGRRIRVQATTSQHVTEESFNVNGLIVTLETGAGIYHSTVVTSGEDAWIVNLDHSSIGVDTPFGVTFELNPNSYLSLGRNGFKNKGTSLGTNNFSISKQIVIRSEGTIYQGRTVENGDTPGDYIIFDANAAGTGAGTGTYRNDGNALISVVGGRVHSVINPIFKGGVHVSNFTNVEFSAGGIGRNIDPNVVPFIESVAGLYNRVEKCSFYNFGIQSPKALFKIAGAGSNVLLIEPLVNGGAESLVEVDPHVSDLGQDPGFTMYNSTTKDGITASVTLFKVNGVRAARWQAVYFNNNYITRAPIDETKVDLTGGNYQGVMNFIGRPADTSRQITYHLPRFGSRAAAASIMPVGTLYMNTNGMPIGTPDPSWKIDVVI